MEERQVEVIKKLEGPVIKGRRLVGKPLTITRKTSGGICACQYKCRGAVAEF